MAHRCELPVSSSCAVKSYCMDEVDLDEIGIKEKIQTKVEWIKGFNSSVQAVCGYEGTDASAPNGAAQDHLP
jgi:hypothetical protein